MTREEAKYILQACRHPDMAGGDARVLEALALLEQDEELAEWLVMEEAFDEAMTAGIEAWEPPADLKERLLALQGEGEGDSVKVVSFPEAGKRRWWQNPRWISMAAGVVLLLSFSFLLLDPQELSADEELAEFYRDVARQVSAGGHGVDVEHSDLDYLRTYLQEHGAPYPGFLPGKVDPLDEEGARVYVWRKVPVGVVHMRNHARYHLYVVHNAVFGRSAAGINKEPTVEVVDGVGIMIWADGDQVHVLATSAGAPALTELLVSE